MKKREGERRRGRGRVTEASSTAYNLSPVTRARVLHSPVTAELSSSFTVTVLSDLRAGGKREFVVRAMAFSLEPR